MGRLSTGLGRLREVELLFCCIWLHETKAVIGITLVRATTLLSFTFNPMVQKWGGYVDVLYQWSPGSIWGVMSSSSKHFLNILLNFDCNFCLSKYSTTPVVTAVTTISTTTSNTVLHFFAFPCRVKCHDLTLEFLFLYLPTVKSGDISSMKAL